MLIAFSGQPGTGKTTISRMLALRMPAVHVRVDTIEQALLRSGLISQHGTEGYVVACGVAADNLRLGHHVIADCVNAIQKARDGWVKVAQACGVPYLFVHLICTDEEEHRHRVSQRQADIDGHVLPTWAQVLTSNLDPAAPGSLLIDTCAHSAESAVETILSRLG